ncbi:MAG: radical SAM protein [Candidatus Muirbacterium halophilum]|nr:radical SAM protein [Candidatus Muirbacterium halophilum]MCK9474659.1 radical SAM protein [Candidatus Muirbacterium halophilum]
MKKLLFVRMLQEVPSFAVSPPLGIISIIPYVKENFPDYKINLFDNGLPYQRMNSFFDYIKENKPDILLYSITYTERDIFFPTIKKVKELYPDITQIAGGIGVTCSPDEIFEKEELDFVVLSDGEERLVNILENLESGKQDFIDGIGYFCKSQNKKILNPVTSYFDNLDKYGIPSWELVDLKTYSRLLTRNTILKTYPYATIMSARGCPYGCPYCHMSFGYKIRVRSVANVIKELKLLKSLGVKEIHFLDDTFNLPRSRAFELMNGIIDEKFNFTIAWQGIRMDNTDKELLDIMKKAGGYNIEFGVQHVDDKIREELDRKFDFKKIFENVKYAEKIGFITQAHYIYGFPGEKLEQSKKNLEFALKLDSSLAAFFKLTPYPGTKYGRQYIGDYSEIPSKEFHFYSGDEKLNLSDIPTPKLYSFQNYSHQKYYLRPIKALKIFFKIPKNRYFWEHVAGEFFKRFLTPLYKIWDCSIGIFKKK